MMNNRHFRGRPLLLSMITIFALLAFSLPAFAQTSLPFERISFAPGETSAQVSGNVPANTVVRYLVAASTGQEMQVAVTSPNSNVYLSVVAPDGTILASAPAGAKSYSGTLPQTGDYIFRVSTTPGLPATTFTLDVSVTGIPLERIEFASGATSAQVNGQVDGTEMRGYILEAFAGQRMQLALTSTTNPVYLTLISPNGTPLARAETGAQSYDQSLTESGEYIIHVSTPADTPMTSYTLNVTITGVVSGGNTSQRIRFAAGATSAQVSGRILGAQVNTYLLTASAGQQMQVSIASPYSDVYLTLVSPGGTPLARAQAGAQGFNGYLPESGDYQLRVLNPSGTVNSSYVLYVAVTGSGNSSGGNTTSRISFASGATSAQVSGRIDGTQINTYLLNARAGQQMQVTVTSQLADVYLTLVSPTGSPLARAQAGAQSFNGTLPETGDYRLSVSSPSGTAHSNYVLTVSVTGGSAGGGNLTSRISFAAGSNSAQVNGQVDGGTTRTYLLDARAGQRMLISLTSVSSPVYLTVVAPSGAVLAQASLGEQSLDRFLPDNGDYSIQISTTPGTALTGFTLTVSVL